MKKMKDSGVKWIGELPTTWRTTRIKFIAQLSSGGTPSRAHPEYWGGNIPWIKTGELKDGIIFDSEEHITSIGLTNSSTKLFPKGTLLMAMYGQTRGMTGCLGKDAAINQACLAFTSLSDIRNDYFWMALRAIYDPIRELAVGSGQPNLNSKLISNFSIPIPPYDTQEKIASVLNENLKLIDQAIARQQKTIVKLEEYRRAIVVKIVTKGIDACIPMKDSGIKWIGAIPATWRITRIKFVAQLSSGGTPSRDHSEYWGGNIPWVTTGDLNGNEITTTMENISQLGLKNSSSKVFPRGTVLVAMYGGAGTIGKCGILGGDYAINQALCAIKCGRDLNPSYLLYQMHAIRPYWMRLAAGTRKDPNISQELIANEEIVFPPYDDQLKIVSELNGINIAVDEAIDRKNQIIEKLEEYRRSLIHATVTGRIDCTKEPL